MDAKTRGLLLLAVLSLVCAYFALAGGRGLFGTVFFALCDRRSRCNPEALALGRALRRACGRRCGGPHFPDADRATGATVDVGERPQER